MNFQFDSLYQFWYMNGHGPYVWASYGIAALVLVYLVAAPLWRKKRFLRRERGRLRRLAQGQEQGQRGRGGSAQA